MFYNNRVSIYFQGEDRKLIEIYTDIKAQLYKKKTTGKDRDNSISENTVKEVMVVCLEPDKMNVRAGNIIKYKDKFGTEKTLKAGEPEVVDALYFKNLIQIKCDLV